MNRKILLIDPPFQKFMNFSKNGIPLGLLHLAGELESRGDDVRVFDADYNIHGESYPFISKIEHYNEYLLGLNNKDHPIWKDIAKKIEEISPEIVGISLISTKLKSGLNIAEIAKNLGVKKVIVGGPHATLFPQEIIDRGNGYIDGVVVGEGEEVFEEVISKGGIIRAGRIRDLNKIAWPARSSLVGIEDYSPEDLGFVITSRGCPNSCNFCCSDALWGSSVRRRNIKDVLKEIDYIHNTYKTKKFYVVDDTFTLGRSRVGEFCDGMKERGLSWSCLTRVDKLDEELVKKMIDSNCSMVKIGVESGSQKVLDLMQKGTTIEEVEYASKILNNGGLHWLAYIMVGVPGETERDVDLTMDLIRKTKPSYVSAAVYTPYPGTGFAKQEIGEQDFVREAANHHSLEVLAGDVSREKIKEFMAFADKYNHESKKAKEIYKC